MRQFTHLFVKSLMLARCSFMFTRARHDHIHPLLLLGGGIAVVALFILLSVEIDVSRFGISFPRSHKESSSIFAADAFDGVSVQAKAYVVYDLVDQVVVASKHDDEVLPLASLTKVMTALTALKDHNGATLITLRDASIDGGYDLGLKKGQVWRLDELLKYTLVFSSNDGAQAIADSLGGEQQFVRDMNTLSALLGLSLSFTDPAGLDEGGNWGGKGTALDMAKLFAAARKLHPELLEATTHPRVTVRAGKDLLTGVPNTNQTIGGYFGAEASKTGFTDDAGGNLGVIVDTALGHPVVIIVLGSTREGRFEDVKTLYDALLTSIK